VKADTVGRTVVNSKDDFIKKVRSSLRSLQKLPGKVRSFFEKDPCSEPGPRMPRIFRPFQLGWRLRVDFNSSVEVLERSMMAIGSSVHAARAGEAGEVLPSSPLRFAR